MSSAQLVQWDLGRDLVVHTVPATLLQRDVVCPKCRKSEAQKQETAGSPHRSEQQATVTPEMLLG